MEILMDDPATEQRFNHILKAIKLYKNGEVSTNLSRRGINYKMNWGVSIPDLRAIAAKNEPSHLLALKLWNKQWRETMILATLLDEPQKVTEQQMDFWTKSFENVEIAEQASANLWWKTPMAYVKALEWCRGKKHWVRYTGIHLMGRLGLSDKKSPDEIFEPFFEELVPLAKDKELSTVIARAVSILANRSEFLRLITIEFIRNLNETDSQAAKQVAAELEDDLQNF